jgi:translation initiation factor 1 (eIF-1/SUI1)
VGFELFGCNLQEIARMLGKKLGTGAAVITVEHKELSCEGIQI